ncbi:MAG: hypothetical protein RL685_3458 [Pseudomonadota bacterium]|jgi:hypothetical protein
MQVRASYLPQLHAPIVLRFHEHGAEVIAEGEVAWRRTITNGGEFGVRFTALDSRSVQTLKALCGVAGLEEADAYTQPGGAVAPISSRAPTSSGVSSGSVTTSSGGVVSVGSGTPSSSAASSRSRTASSVTSSGATSSAGRDLDHDTDPAPPATLGVRLHVAGLSAPLQARVKAQVSNRLELGSQLDFLRVGRALEVEDLAYGGKRTAYVESLDVSVDPKSRVPELVVSVRYADASDAAHPGASRIGTPEPQRARSLARGRSYWETEVPSSTPPPTTPRPAPERGRTPAPPELDLSNAAESGDGSSDGALDGEDERDTTPPPLRVDRAERPAAAASKSADKPSSKEPSSKQPTVELAARARGEEEEQEPADVDSTEALLARLDGLLRGVPQAARAASEQVARWGGAASRSAGQLFAQARRAMSASRRPAAPRRRTAAAPRSSLRSSPLRQSSQPSSQQRPRIDVAADALRRRGTRTVLWSCLVAVLAIGIGYAARPSRQVATPAAARVSSATAAALPAPAASVPLARASAASEPLPPLGAAPLRVPSASVAEDEVGVPPSNDGPSSKSQPQDESPPSRSPARGQSVTAGSDEFGQGRMRLPVIYRLRLDEPGGSLRGERTATGFDITIVGRRVLDSANAIAKRDSRIAKVSTHNSSQGTRVSFRFRDEIPAYKVRLRRDAVEFLISSS